VKTVIGTQQWRIMQVQQQQQSTDSIVQKQWQKQGEDTIRNRVSDHFVLYYNTLAERKQKTPLLSSALALNADSGNRISTNTSHISNEKSKFSPRITPISLCRRQYSLLDQLQQCEKRIDMLEKRVENSTFKPDASIAADSSISKLEDSYGNFSSLTLRKSSNIPLSIIYYDPHCPPLAALSIREMIRRLPKVSDLSSLQSILDFKESNCNEVLFGNWILLQGSVSMARFLVRTWKEIGTQLRYDDIVNPITSSQIDQVLETCSVLMENFSANKNKSVLLRGLSIGVFLNNQLQSFQNSMLQTSRNFLTSEQVTLADLVLWETLKTHPEIEQLHEHWKRFFIYCDQLDICQSVLRQKECVHMMKSATITTDVLFFGERSNEREHYIDRVRSDFALSAAEAETLWKTFTSKLSSTYQ